MGMSLQQRVALLPERERQAYLTSQPDYIRDEMLRGEWWWTARPEQVPPIDVPWFICLALAGRGWGKSRAGSEWIVDRVSKHPFDQHGAPTEWLVIGETLSDARAICLEGPAGILRVLERRKIKHAYLKSPRPRIVFPSGAKIHTEGADDKDVGRGYNASGAWLDEICVAEGALVTTDRGDVPIEAVAVGDMVLVRDGTTCRVSAVRQTSTAAEVVRLRTGRGDLFLTPNHRVWLDNGPGWTAASDVRPGDIVLTCPSQMNRCPATPPPSTTGTVSAGFSISAWATTSTDRARFSIEAFGRKFMAKSRPVTRSITSTVSDGTTGLAIWNASLSVLTGSSRRSSATTGPGRKIRLQKLFRLASRLTGGVASLAKWCVRSVGKPTSVPECAPSGAPRYAAMPLPGSIKRSRVLDVEKASGRRPVYDLTVDGLPEFFANGILVHNCKWRWPKESWDEGIMPSLRADLAGDQPRAFVTTTPKPIKLLNDWINRTDGSVHLMRGSTFDNSTNLSAAVLVELRNRYEGTVIGRQELYGEMIEAFEGALFSRLDLENYRVAVAPDQLVSTIVGVDPSLTGEDDEMGVVVVGNTADRDMWVLADRSVMSVGRAAALHCWRVFAEFNADLLVYEENLGKRWMRTVFEDAYYELVKQDVFQRGTRPPMKGVDAKIGKRTRGEPVAMRSEQGRLHMVGRQPELEDQMVTFVSWGTHESPDRLDALVHACRWIMAGEKKASTVTSASDLSSTLQQLFAQTARW